MSSTGWTCPRCGRVWGPSVQACAPCNQTIGLSNAQGWGPATTGTPLPRGGQVIAKVPTTALTKALGGEGE